MKALAKLAVGPGYVGVVDRPVPTARPGHVVLEVHAAGVCGTDLHIEAGEYPTSLPVTMGHEISGVVAAVGANVDGDWASRRVTTETFFSTCGRCAACRDGQPNLCQARQSIGSHVNGGFAPYVVVPAVNLHPLPDWLDSAVASLAEPLACVCNCLLDPPAVQPGDEVVVIGPGPVGLLAAQVARTMGGSVRVCGLPQDAERLTVAADLGFSVTDDGPGTATADVVIECSGSEQGLKVAIGAARPGAHAVQVGMFGGDVTIPLNQVVYAELVVSSGFASTPRSWRRAMRLITTKAVELVPLVTKVAPLEAWEDVFADLRAGRGLKIVFDPRI